MLANSAGQADDMLIAAGQVVITGGVTTLGYRQVIIAGQRRGRGARPLR